jgi:hypothetical protein
MDEIIPGVFHWSAFHEGIRMQVHSALVRDAGVLIDPMLPPGGPEAVERLGRPERIVLSNRHHYRHSAAFVEAFGCPVPCHEAGLHEFEGGPEVQGFAFGDEIAPGVRALEVGAICPEETALHLAPGRGALACADGVIGGRSGLQFVPDGLLGDDPEGVKQGLREAYRKLLDEAFDALLLAHGNPVPTGGKERLRRFVTG